MAMETAKPYRGLGMEGMTARWYAKNTAKSMEDYRRAAAKVAQRLAPGAHVLEVAPGPGYLAIALARLGPYVITGLDISESFVRMADERARNEGVRIDFRKGNAAAMPFGENTFDAVVCRAAFKNFSQPVEALDEMYRVLRPGGFASIIDLDKNATPEQIADAVRQMRLGPINSWITRMTFKHMLLKRAYRPEDMRAMAAASRFKSCELRPDGIGFEASFRKPVASAAPP
jgi:ubiquinone/menaquinone biosynthesis C-methylase UbiE